MSELVLDPRREAHGDRRQPVLVWTLPAGAVAISSAVRGGGIGAREWVLNAQVDKHYDHADPAEHVAAIAASLGLDPLTGAGLLTAAPVLQMTSAQDGGVECVATVGITTPTWAAAEDGASSTWAPGTINIVCWLPAALGDAALVNAVVTATEAKAQAMAEAGVPGTGTASDAIVVCCRPGGNELYGGPRSRWGAPLARAVHHAVAAGIDGYAERTR